MIGFAFFYACLLPCIHSHVSATYSKNIFKIPMKYIPLYLIKRCRRLRVLSSEAYTLLDGIYTLGCNGITMINEGWMYNILQFIKPPFDHQIFHSSVTAKLSILRLWFAKSHGGNRSLPPQLIGLAPAACSFSNKALKSISNLFQTNFKVKFYVYTESEIPGSFGFLSFSSAPFCSCSWIPCSMLFTFPEWTHLYLKILFAVWFANLQILICASSQLLFQAWRLIAYGQFGLSRDHVQNSLLIVSPKSKLFWYSCLSEEHCCLTLRLSTSFSQVFSEKLPCLIGSYQ